MIISINPYFQNKLFFQKFVLQKLSFLKSVNANWTLTGFLSRKRVISPPRKKSRNGNIALTGIKTRNGIIPGNILGIFVTGFDYQKHQRFFITGKSSVNTLAGGNES